jgi:hypothetical protein
LSFLSFSLPIMVERVPGAATLDGFCTIIDGCRAAGCGCGGFVELGPAGILRVRGLSPPVEAIFDEVVFPKGLDIGAATGVVGAVWE